LLKQILNFGAKTISEHFLTSSQQHQILTDWVY